MDTAQCPQDMLGLAKPNNMEESNNINNKNTSPQHLSMERRLVRPQKEQALNCPRCHSTNTKFCYYNNYSLTQPRYFCKTCRRYWTEGGSLRNVPVGGGSRKNNKRSSSSSSTDPLDSPPKTPSTTSTKKHVIENPKLIQDAPDLNLAFSTNTIVAHSSSATNTISAVHPFLPMYPMTMLEYPLSALPTLDICNINGGLMQGSGRVLFPFEETGKALSCSNNNGNSRGVDHDQLEQAKGFWSSMMGGGGGGSW